MNKLHKQNSDNLLLELLSTYSTGGDFACVQLI
jgi:hypothetical protein